MEPPIITKPQRHAGFLHGGDGVFRFAFGQRERLLAEHVLAGRRCGDHLRAVHRMRRGENHGVNGLIGEDRAVIRLELKAVLLGKRLGVRRHGACRAGNEADDVAAFGRFNDRLAPPAKPDNGRFDHLILPLFITLVI